MKRFRFWHLELARVSRPAALYLALAAMLFRAFLPDGWMPGTTPQGQMALVICTMDGPMQGMSMPMNDFMDGQMHMPMGHGDAGHHEQCPFAAAPHHAPAPNLAMLSLPSLAVEAILETHDYDSLKDGRRRTPHSPRAPPVRNA